MSGDCAAVVSVTEIEWVPEVVTDREAAAAFGGWREPEAGIAGFGDFGNFFGDLLPAQIEELEHGFASGSERDEHQSSEEEKQDRTLWKHGPRVAEPSGKRKLTVG